MNVLKRVLSVSVSALFAAALVAPASAQSTSALLKDTNRQHVGSVSLTQTAAGVLLKFSLNGMPPGEHAFHIHAVGKCAPKYPQRETPHLYGV